MEPRFEIVGDLWGTIEIVCPLPVLDISSGGALIRADRPWELGSVHALSIGHGGDIGDARVCVRHVRACPGERNAFFVGVAFLALSPALAEQIAEWVTLGGDAIEA